MRSLNEEFQAIFAGNFEQGWKDLKVNLDIYQFSLVVSKKNSFFIIGGQKETIEGFEPTNQVTQYKFDVKKLTKYKTVKMAPMKNCRTDACCAINDVSNEIFVMGGVTNDLDTTSCEKLDISRNKWSQLPPLNEAKNLMTSLIINNSHLYVFGGACGSSHEIDLTY